MEWYWWVAIAAGVVGLIWLMIKCKILSVLGDILEALLD